MRDLSWCLESYSPRLDLDASDRFILDLGDLDFLDLSMHDALNAIADAMEFAAGISGLPVMIGGEHTVTLGSYRGIKRVHPDALLIQLDAHLDLRDQYDGEPITHASWVYHAGKEHGFTNIIQFGVRSGAREEWPRARDLAHWSGEALALPDAVRRHLVGRPVYLTIDIDVLDPAYAPGTGSPEPGGHTFREVCDLLYTLKDLNIVGMDVVEVAPRLDPSGITAVAAAKLIRESLLLFGKAES
ncbi:MAG: agmatinase [Gemmatimonadaceae bacterium]